MACSYEKCVLWKRRWKKDWGLEACPRKILQGHALETVGKHLDVCAQRAHFLCNMCTKCEKELNLCTRDTGSSLVIGNDQHSKMMEMRGASLMMGATRLKPNSVLGHVSEQVDLLKKHDTAHDQPSVPTAVFFNLFGGVETQGCIEVARGTSVHIHAAFL